MKRIALLVLLLFAACAPSQSAIQTAIVQTQAAWTRVPTQTAYPTYTIIPSSTIIPSRTPTLYPTATAFQTFTPTPPLPPVTQTQQAKNIFITSTAEFMAQLESDKTDGFYLVGSEIAPGNWRSDKGYSDCYWEITDANSNIIQNFFGDSGGVMHIPSSAYQVQLKDCGTFTFLK